MVFCLYTLTTSTSRSKDLLDVLKSIAGPTVFIKGCISSTIWQNPDHPGRFLLHEEWHTLADLERHIQSTIYHRLLSAMELCIAKPEVVFADGYDRRGMEWMEKVRSLVMETDLM